MPKENQPKDDTEADATFSDNSADFSSDNEDEEDEEARMIRDEHKGRATSPSTKEVVDNKEDAPPQYEKPVDVGLTLEKRVVPVENSELPPAPPAYDIALPQEPPPAFPVLDSPKLQVNYSQLALQYKGPKTLEKIPPRVLDCPYDKRPILKPIYRNCVIIPTGRDQSDYESGIQLLDSIGDGSHQVQEDLDVPFHYSRCSFVDRSVVNRFDNLASFFTVWQRPHGVEEKLRDQLVSECDCIFYVFDLMRTDQMLSMETNGQYLRDLHEHLLSVNPSIIPILVGTNYEQFSSKTIESQTKFVRIARTMARLLSTALVFVSCADGTNIEELFDLAFALSRNNRSFTYVLTNPKTKEAILEYHYLMSIQSMKNRQFQESYQKDRRRVRMENEEDSDDEDDEDDEELDEEIEQDNNQKDFDEEERPSPLEANTEDDQSIEA